jgi:hypothetical protein
MRNIDTANQPFEGRERLKISISQWCGGGYWPANVLLTSFKGRASLKWPDENSSLEEPLSSS